MTSLRDYSTESLREELNRRRECVDCGRDRPLHAAGWSLASANRTRCPDCANHQDEQQPKLWSRRR